MKPTLRERFWANTQHHVGYGACWLWQGSSHDRGDGNHYGLLHFAGSRHWAHRLAYELLRGPIPPGFVVDHLCRTTLCVNPDHLEPVSGTINVLRGVGPTAVNARKERCDKGHALVDHNLSVRRGRRYCRTCQRAIDKEWQRAARKRRREAALDAALGTAANAERGEKL